MQGSLLGNRLLRAIAPPHLFILQNCDRLFNRPHSLEKIKTQVRSHCSHYGR
ncbi:hypothetical protein [Cylindrospermopsis raciborskii]|uniref:hypothetical protein n=1 Tax=Cylindrospermopsis raciborskii TaxID=77022 RepID=UPI0015C42118|nr:hypothetical protein [Cylindrospermopsis raciborskii]